MTLDFLRWVKPFSTVHFWFLPVLLMLLTGIALAAPATASRLSRALHRLIGAVARRPLVSALAAALPAALAALLFYLAAGLPVPRVHDEFSYLLAADTFLHGRLANKPHPLWAHFESFHINQTPTYASMYPPGQGLTLAAGTVLFGNPWAGVWLSVLILCLITGWALRGWMPARWALAGGVMAATLVSFGYWMTSYWGGAVAALGGALVLGAWPRLKRAPRVRDSLLFALGIAILANTRMYEGAVLAAVAVADGILSALRHPVAARRVYLRRAVLPAGLALLAASCWMMFYFWRVTGHPFLMPYVANFRTCGYHGLFVWQGVRPQPFYLHEVMRRLYVDVSALSRSDPAFLPLEVWPTLDQFGGALLLLPLCSLWWLAGFRGKSRKSRGLLVATLAVAAAVSMSSWIRPHYPAPILAGAIGLIVQSLRYLSTLRLKGRRVGRFAAQGLLLLWLAAQWNTGFFLLQLKEANPAGDWALRRAAIRKTLEQSGKKHLILVRYSPEHDPHAEWVYNGADLFDAPVLWARDMGPDLDSALIRYCEGRTVWLLEPDRAASLVPY